MKSHLEQQRAHATAYRKEYLKARPWAKHWMYAKIRATRLAREITLTAADFKVLWLRDNAHLLRQPSIDRIDSSKGYVEGNCRFIERSENCGRTNLGRKATQKQREAGRKNIMKWNHSSQAAMLKGTNN